MINLWDGYVIDTDAYNFILGQPKPGKRNGKDETYMDNATYYPTLPKALEAFSRMQLKESIKSNDTDLKSALVAYSDIERRLSEIARGI